MNLHCVRCGAAFEAAAFRGYCDACMEHWRTLRERVHAHQRPAPNVLADGKFVNEGPRSVFDPVRGVNVCGLCGSLELESGYGLGSGLGMGAYNYCADCNSFLDFSEDRE